MPISAFYILPFLHFTLDPLKTSLQIPDMCTLRLLFHKISSEMQENCKTLNS
jgi:hypothetical protein